MLDFFWKSRLNAYRIGIIDGWRSPFDLSSGMSWGDERDEVYDRGVNLGQRLRSPIHHQRTDG